MRSMCSELGRSALTLRFLMALAALLIVPGVASAQDAEPSQIWAGSFEVPTGDEIEVIIRVFDAPGGQTATMDIPIQGVADMPLDAAHFGETAHFEFSAVGAVFDGEMVETGVIEGVLSQGGMEMPLRLRRIELEEIADLGPERPQTPVGPFPYQEREVRFTNYVDGTEFAATLTIPDGEGPHPAVVFITGSGPQDRDETLFGHKPFWVMSDALARRGIASLRADDRGEGGSGGVLFDTTIEMLATDTEAGVNFLTTIPEIDSARIGLIGHSEGGTIAPHVAAQSDHVSFLVLIAGTGIDGRSLMSIQLRAIMEGLGVPQIYIDPQIEAQQRLFGAITGEAPRDEVLGEIRGLIEMQMAGQGDEATIQQMVDQQAVMLTSIWFRSFLMFDPRPALEQVTVPVLAVNGSLDLQVPPDPNLLEIDAALARAGNRDVTSLEFEGLNHLMQESVTGSIAEYAQIEQTISPDVLETIVIWIADHAGL